MGCVAEGSGQVGCEGDGPWQKGCVVGSYELVGAPEYSCRGYPRG